MKEQLNQSSLIWQQQDIQGFGIIQLKPKSIKRTMKKSSKKTVKLKTKKAAKVTAKRATRAKRTTKKLSKVVEKVKVDVNAARPVTARAVRTTPVDKPTSIVIPPGSTTTADKKQQLLAQKNDKALKTKLNDSQGREKKVVEDLQKSKVVKEKVAFSQLTPEEQRKQLFNTFPGDEMGITVGTKDPNDAYDALMPKEAKDKELGS